MSCQTSLRLFSGAFPTVGDLFDHRNGHPVTRTQFCGVLNKFLSLTASASVELLSCHAKCSTPCYTAIRAMEIHTNTMIHQL